MHKPTAAAREDANAKPWATLGPPLDNALSPLDGGPPETVWVGTRLGIQTLYLYNFHIGCREAFREPAGLLGAPSGPSWAPLGLPRASCPPGLPREGEGWKGRLGVPRKGGEEGDRGEAEDGRGGEGGEGGQERDADLRLQSRAPKAVFETHKTQRQRLKRMNLQAWTCENTTVVNRGHLWSIVVNCKRSHLK